MTTPVAYQVDQRRGRAGRGARELYTFAGDFRRELLDSLEIATTTTFPSTRWRDDPVRFFREVLGVEPWSKQREIIEAVRDHDRVSVSSGHKVSKSHSAAGLALWYFCSFEDARVVMTSTTARQVDQILWRELRMVRARSGRCTECKKENQRRREENPVNPDLIPNPCPHSAAIPEVPGELARTGMKSRDFREIVGFTAREAEAVAGVSGRHLLYIVDEASGVSQEIFEAIEGNRAGGAKIVLFSNPTRNEGEHFDSFHSKKHLYKAIRVSSEETPNVLAGRVVIPGLATRAWIDEKKEEWGEDSPLYKVRVRGEHALAEDGKIFSIHAIGQSQERWHETSDAGRLYVGLDPAGPSGTSDETCFCLRRGLKAMRFVLRRGLDETQIGTELLALILEARLPKERAVVVMDREGSIGAKVFGYLGALEERRGDVFALAGVRASEKAIREPRVYDRLRDELTANLYSWLIRDGGAIPEDDKLTAELHAPEWEIQVNGRQKVTAKKKLRQILGRSPDRYDSLALSVWEPAFVREQEDQEEQEQDVALEDLDPVAALDPYAGSDGWG